MVDDGKIVCKVSRRKRIITPYKCYCGISQNGFFFGEEYKQYLTFSVEIISNTLISAFNDNVWNEGKKYASTYKSTHDSGKGYRTIAKLLNAENLKTAKGNKWNNTNILAVLKR